MKKALFVFSLVGLCMAQNQDSIKGTEVSAIMPETAAVVLEHPPVRCYDIRDLSANRGEKTWVDSIVNAPENVKRFDSLFALYEPVRYVKKYKTPQPVYYGAAFRTLPFSEDKILARIQDFRSYRSMFKYVRDFQLISSGEKEPLCVTAYSEIGAFMFKAWFILNLDSITQDSLQRTGVYFSKNHLGSLNAVWDQKNKPTWTYLAREIMIRFYVKKVDENHTRVAYLLAVDSKSSVPGWIFKLVGKQVFPRFMKDLGASLEPAR